MKKVIISSLFLILIVSIQAQVPTVNDIKETSSLQSRDLSLPESRIVINPFNFWEPSDKTASEYSNRPYLPLNIAYLATERVASRKANNILSFYHYEPGSTGNFEYIWEGNLTDLSQWKKEAQTTLQVTDKGLKFTLDPKPNPAWKYMSNQTPISVDLDKSPVLTISIAEFSGSNWSLKMKNGQGTEVVLRHDSQGIGIFEYPLKEISGWTGTQQITFFLYCIDGNTSIIINDWNIIQLGDDFSVKEASAYTTAWMPNELPFEASYEDGSSIEGTDFFYDLHTLVRKIRWDKKGATSKFLLSGAYHGENIYYEDNILYQEKGVYTIAISSDVFKKYPIKFYRSLTELKIQSNGKDTPEKSGYWCVQIDPDEFTQMIASVAFSYANDNEDKSILTERVKQPLIGENAEIAYQNRIKYWNDYLAKLPHPTNFSIESVDALDVTPEAVKLAYYKAWVFTAYNLLMGDPLKFPYPQVVTGKASVWDEGHELAPYTATWESFFGIQFLAFTDPENAWKAFEGIMSLTDEEGVIGGESLPSRKAQTAWLLYEMTGEKERLEAIYDPLERYLIWRLKYPHWIFHSEPDVTQKDAEFAFSVIVDIEFMAEIASVVKGESVAEEWRKRAKDFYTESLPWFWKTPKSMPVQYYNTRTQDRNAGSRYWVTSGLFMEMLDGEYLKSMMNLFSLGFNARGNFGGPSMGIPKYPDISYTLYGLITKGYIGKAENVMDVCIRDIVRSGNWFSEQYETSGEPYPYGVRPSFFGASVIIDFVMMKNGFWYGKGTPTALNAFKGERSIQNIHFGDKIINLSRSNDDNITLSGSYVGNAYTQASQAGDFFPIKRDGDTSISLIETAKKKPYALYSEEEMIRIQLNDLSVTEVSYQIFSLNGMLIKTSDRFSFRSSGSQIIIPKFDLLSGIYLLQMKIDENYYTEKIICS